MKHGTSLTLHRPPALTPGMVRLCDVLASRAALADSPADENPLSFHFEPVPVSAEQAREPAARLALEAGGFLWGLEFQDLDFLSSNEVFAGIRLDHLPESLVRAVLLGALHSFLDRLEDTLKTPVNPYDGADSLLDPSGWLRPVLRFTLNFTGGVLEEDSARENGRRWKIPFGLRVASEEGAAWLGARILDACPRLRRNPDRASWRLAVTLEAGAMRVPVDVLRNLALADILIPSDYPAKDGRLRLILPGGSGFDLEVSDGRTIVIDYHHDDIYDKEMNVSSPDLPDGASALSSLEVPIRFELEKKLLPLAEIEALAPGRAFPLGVDPASPVTVTLNGQALAAGRLIDIGGVLGVQITRLIGNPETS
jgi:type III secretion system YscQ/HrcQ family protein